MLHRVLNLVYVATILSYGAPRESDVVQKIVIVAGPADIGSLGNSLVGVNQRLLDHPSIADAGSGRRLSVIELIEAGLALEGQVSGLSVREGWAGPVAADQSDCTMGYRYALTNFPAYFIYIIGLNDQQSGVL